MVHTILIMFVLSEHLFKFDMALRETCVVGIVCEEFFIGRDG